MPPFGFDVGEYLSGYASALLIATKIVPEERGIPLSESKRLILPERLRLEERLLEMERLYGGRSFAYVGTCLYCPEGSCTRPTGEPCRHPDKVRPSLEACGFDIGRTTTELFGMDLKWGTDGRIPRSTCSSSAAFSTMRKASSGTNKFGAASGLHYLCRMKRILRYILPATLCLTALGGLYEMGLRHDGGVLCIGHGTVHHQRRHVPVRECNAVVLRSRNEKRRERGFLPANAMKLGDVAQSMTIRDGVVGSW